MSYTNDTKPMATFTNDAKPSNTTSYLLKEDSFFLLLETGGKIVLSRSNDYQNDVKPA